MRPKYTEYGAALNARSRAVPVDVRAAVADGVVAGVLAAVAVALWFLVMDLLAGTPLDTPARLGQATASLFGLAFTSSAMAVLGYTLIHGGIFLLLGLAAAVVVDLSRRHATALAGVLLLFAVAQLGFLAMLALLSQTTVTFALTWFEVLVGNLLGWVVLGVVLLRRHPELRGNFSAALSGTRA